MANLADLFDRKQLGLWKISSRADTLSHIVVVVYVFLAFGEAYRYAQLANEQFETTLLGLFSRHPIYILDVFFQMARIITRGAVYFLVLKGIALGLNMIVETDINYREKDVEGGEE